MKHILLTTLAGCIALGAFAQAGSKSTSTTTSVFASSTTSSAPASGGAGGGQFTGAEGGSVQPADAHWGSIGVGSVISIAQAPQSGQFFYFKQSALWEGGQKGSRLRLGLGVAFKSSKDTATGDNQTTTNSFSINPRVGYEMLNQVANRFTIGYGGEFGINYSSSSSKSKRAGDEKHGSNNFGIGVGPMASAYWMASQYLMLGVESVFYVYYDKTSFTPGSASSSNFQLGLLPVYRFSLAVRFK